MYLVVCRLMLGMMLATWFLSMWISNTSTTAMMIPIIEAIVQQLRSAGVARGRGLFIFFNLFF